MVAESLYTVATRLAKRDTSTGPLLVFTAVMCGTAAAATQVVAARLRYNVILGKPLAHTALPFLHAVYAPWAFAQWVYLFWSPIAHVHYRPAVYAALWQTLPVTFLVGAVVGMVAVIVMVLRMAQKTTVENIDSARWAEAPELEREGFFNSAGLVIGAFERKRGQLEALRYDGELGVEHTAVPGDAKSVQLETSLLIPLQRAEAERVALYGDTAEGRRADFFGEEPTIIGLDVKGALHRATSAYQRDGLGKEVLIVEPLSESAEGRATFNPLWSLRVGTPFFARDCYEAVLDVIPPGATPTSFSTHWDSSSTAFGSAVLGVLAYRALQQGPRGYQLLSWPAVVDYISTRTAKPAVDEQRDEAGNVIIAAAPAKDAIEVLIEDMLLPQDPHHAFGWHDLAGKPCDVEPWIVSAALAMLAKHEDERTSIHSTFLERLGIFRDQVLRQHCSTSTFTFRELCNRSKAAAVYLVIPAMSLQHYRLYISMFFRTAIRDLTHSTAEINGREIRASLRSWLLVLDEIATLGREPTVALASGFIRGHGGQIVAIFQSVQQKLEHYGAHESLTATMGAHIIGRPESDADAKLISDALGKFSTVVTKRSTSAGRGGSTESLELETRQLLTPVEVKRLPKDENIIQSRGLTIRAKKYPYFTNPALVDRAKLGRVMASDVLATEPFFVTNLRGIHGDAFLERLRAPWSAAAAAPKSEPIVSAAVVLSGRIDDPVAAFRAGKAMA